jgi:type IV pilus assembly protein PilP
MIKKLLQINNHVSMIAVVLFCALLLTACDKEQTQTPVPTKSVEPTVPKQKSTALLPKPVQIQTSSVSRIVLPSANQFDFSNKKDPFKPFVVIKSDKNNLESRDKVQNSSLPIHSFDVNQFKLIGIITGGRENKAMVTDPGGKGYVLKVGMLIGKNDGKVISISSNGVDILEQFKDDNGRVRKDHQILTLPRKQ